MQCNWRCVACGGLHNLKDPNRVLVLQDSVNASDAKVLRGHAEISRAEISRALFSCWPSCKLAGGNPVDTIFEGL